MIVDHKKILVTLSLFLCITIKSFCQDSCYNCNRDSIATLAETTKDITKKIELLKLFVDLKIGVAGSAQDAEPTRLKLVELLSLAKTNPFKNVEAYQNVLDAITSIQKEDFVHAQLSFKKAIELFDKEHKKIPYYLAALRLTYNSLNKQEERLAYYKEKLNYYLVNGPEENVPACYHAIGGYYLYMADYNYAASNYLKAADLYHKFEQFAYRNDLSVAAETYSQWGNYTKAVEYINIVLPLALAGKDSFCLGTIYSTKCRMALFTNQNEDVWRFADSVVANRKSNSRVYPFSYVWKAFAYLNTNNPDAAFENLGMAKKIADSIHIKIYSASGPLEIDFGYYMYYLAKKNYTQAIQYLLTAYNKSVEVKSNFLQLKYLKELSLYYGAHSMAGESLTYTKKFYELTDSLDKENNSLKVAQYENERKEIQQNDSLNILKQQSAVQAAVISSNNKLLWGSLIAILLISISLFFVYRQYRFNKKTLSSLRKTQRQLIVAEKMASLGELTAGIAHEIQNPHNFVNNFAELNSELITELKEAIEKGDYEDAVQIADDLKTNEEKINFHGKRADAIVKGMLQHSRTSSGQKELTDINALADEYLRLSYHGLRAKDKSFNAKFETNFDTSIGKINIMTQDIGRVLLNLINNAFYAVTEKKKAAGDAYEPEVLVSTIKQNNSVIITVRDNGNGIPKALLDKIFQPFFTTKPTGQGTGLGLSLSYDVVKAHGGEIKVNTQENEFTEFQIQLPIV